MKLQTFGRNQEVRAIRAEIDTSFAGGSPPAAPTADAAPPAPTADDEHKIAMIAKVVGKDPGDYAGILAAVEALVGSSVDAAAFARSKLTEEQIAKCKKAGVHPARFLANLPRRG